MTNTIDAKFDISEFQKKVQRDLEEVNPEFSEKLKRIREAYQVKIFPGGYVNNDSTIRTEDIKPNPTIKTDYIIPRSLVEDPDDIGIHTESGKYIAPPSSIGDPSNGRPYKLPSERLKRRGHW